jgi:hypothetical protein
VRTAAQQKIGGKRFTRLALGFSKKLANLIAAVSPHFAYYNYCWLHGSLNGTPATAAGIAGHPWSLEELFDAVQQAAIR